jgi:FKBP-type peptidyl-prolyl cis-trans isomerase FkpA
LLVVRELDMAGFMKAPSRAARYFVPTMILPLLVAAVPVGAATAPKAKAPAATQRPLSANNSIIPLPLTPVVPAAQRLCGSKTASGLGFTVLRQASGAKPAQGATTLINYVGYLAADGAVFDQGMRSPLPVAEVIAGFSEGLQLLARTEVIRFCIPAVMGYGSRASGPIPANSDLVFQVELLDFKTAAELEVMQKAQSVPAVPEGAAPQP